MANNNPSRAGETVRSRAGSSSSHFQANQHRPTNPSGLRQAHMPPESPEDRRNPSMLERMRENNAANSTAGSAAQILEGAPLQSEPSSMNVEGAIEEPEPSARTRLLGEANKYSIPAHANCDEENCNHGNISPRPRHHRGYGSFAPSVTSADGHAGSYTEGSYGPGVGGSGDSMHGIFGDALADSLMPRDSTQMSTTQYLAKRHDIKHSKMMYVNLVGSPCFSSTTPTRLSNSILILR